MPGPALVPPERPIDVIVVATWFPSHVDLAAGRFIADQVTAIAATGAARPRVVTFRRAALTGGGRTRASQESAVDAAALAELASGDPFHAPAAGVPPALPVARLTIPDGRSPSAGAGHEAAHREQALERLAPTLVGDGAGARTPDSPSRGIVHAHTGYPDGAAATVLAERLGWPLVISEHVSYLDRLLAYPETRDRYATACRGASRIVAVGEHLATQIRTAIPDVADRVVVIPNGIDTSLFRPGPAADRVADELLWVGRLTAPKGTATLIEAFAIVAARRPAARLRLLGRAPTLELDARWRADVDRLGLMERVSFEDTASRADVVAAMRRASAFVHPSRFETFGIVAAEALACGTPVVATNSGGVTEILGPEPTATGAIVPPDDPEALATAIVDVLDRRATFDPEAMHASIAARFDAATVAERWIGLYDDVLRAASALPAAVSLTTTGLAPPVGRRIVVALDRESARRSLAGLPADQRERLWLLTARDPASIAVPATKRVEAIAIDTSWRGPTGSTRAGRILSHPIAALRRAIGTDPGSPSGVAPAVRMLSAMLDEGGPDARAVAVDGHDYLVAAAIAELRPGALDTMGLADLADAWLGAEPR